MRLSICMIVRDEERDLPRCLASLAGAADELIVVDTGSTDRTIELARAAGATVAVLDWPNDFSAARNGSLDAATGDWICVLDADEELPEATRAALRAEAERAQSAGEDGVSLIQRNVSPEGELTAWQDLPLVRLFRRAPHIRYEGRIHEQVSPSIIRAGGALGASELFFWHHGYARTTAQGGVDRARRNLVLLEDAVRTAPGDAYLMYQLGATLKALGNAAAEDMLACAVAANDEMRVLSRSAEADARMKLAQLALARDDNAAALDQARRCRAVDPANATALQTTVVAAFALGQLAEAAAACRALLVCPNVADAPRAEAARLLQMLGGGGRPAGQS